MNQRPLVASAPSHRANRETTVLKQLLPVILLISVLLVSPPARADAQGGFVVTCGYSHTLSDDPIVFPGQPGASHAHDFFGNTSANANSTYDSMVAAPTTCALFDDTAGYWIPTPSLDGVPFHAHGRLGDMRVYYQAAGAQTMDPIPAGLQVIGGDKAANSPPPLGELRWSCGANNPGPKTPVRTHPYDCTPYAAQYLFVDGVVAVVTLPRCWDGAGLEPADLAYPVGGSAADCPSRFSHVLPQVSERIHLGIMDPCAGTIPCGPDDPDTNVRFTFSSGPYYTLHADFWNTWQQSSLDSLVAGCLNAHVHCGFLRSQYTLKVAESGTASGTVTSDPPGIDCGAVCSAPFDAGTAVALTVTPGPDAAFGGWGGACSGTGGCSVTMDRVRSVTATFLATVPAFDLAVTRDGTGTGTVTSSPAGIDCGTVCSASFAPGTAVGLTAAADAGSRFAGWGGACSGTASTCIVAMTAPQSVTATFEATALLTVSRTGPGRGTITSSPPGIRCGQACSGSFDQGTVVVLSATPWASSRFSGWSGACLGASPTCTITLDGPSTVGAAFDRERETLRVSRDGRGTVTSRPPGIRCPGECSHAFDRGKAVRLSAHAAPGWRFVRWKGACRGRGYCDVHMTAPRLVRAVFARLGSRVQLLA
jgi:hypothetical protein